MRRLSWMATIGLLLFFVGAARGEEVARELRIGVERAGPYAQIVIDPLHDRNGRGRTFDGAGFLLAQDGSTVRLTVVEARNARKGRSVLRLRSPRGASVRVTGTVKTWNRPSRIVGFKIGIVAKGVGKFRLSGLSRVWIVGDPAAPTLVVDSQLERDVAVDRSPLHVSGTVIVPAGGSRPASVDWSVAQGGAVSNGAIAVAEDGSWEGDLPLLAGDNEVRLVLHGGRSARRFAAVLNPGYAFAGQLALTPDVAYVGEQREVAARIAIEDLPTGAQAVQLVLVDPAAGETLTAALTDDGALAHGDEIEGDGVFSGKFTVRPSSSGVLEYRVVVGRSSGGSVRSETFRLRAVPHVTETELDAIGALQGAVQSRIELAATSGTLPDTIDDVVAELRANPLVAQVGRSDSGRGVWVFYLAGVAGGAEASAPGVRGAVADSRAAAAPPAVVEGRSDGRRSPGYRHHYAASAPSRGPSKSKASSGPSGVVRSNKAIGVDAQDWDPAWSALGPNEGALVLPLLAADVYTTRHVRYGGKGLGNVEDFKNFGDFGVVLVSTHGDTFFAGVLSKFWDLRDRGVEIVMSNMAATKTAQRAYEDDLVTGRLVLVGGQFAMTPDFFRHHSGRLPGSIVWMGSCRSAFNGELAAAFLELGAGAYLGFSDYVSIRWCDELAKSLFTNLLAPGATLGDAFTAGLSDPYGTTAKFLKYGSPKLSLHITGVSDGGFESGRVSQSWTVEGDARIVASLGQALPTEGGRMAIISTGLGYTTESGSVEQTLRVPDDASEIAFDWDFFSEEFQEFVGSIFQDRFRVTLTAVDGPSATSVLVDETVDSLAGVVAKVANSFDRGDVYATGWRTAVAAIPATMRGRKAILRFSVTDVGDSAYDTAVLLDRVEVR